MGLGVLMGLAIGFPTLRLRDDYLAMVTLGFGQIVYIVANNWMSLTRGPRGIPAIPAPRLELFNWKLVIDNYTSYYYLILFFVALTITACVRVRDSRVGLAWMAIREDEDVAAVMGIHLGFYKTLAFAFSAALGALAGSFFSVFQSFVSPNSFTILESVVIVTIPILGGLGSIPGTIVGAVLMIGLPELFRSASEYRMVAVGAFMVLMMISSRRGCSARNCFRQRTNCDRVALLSVKSLTKLFGGLTALDKFDLQVTAGQIVGIIGPNGSGKTTFFNVLTGMVAANGGARSTWKG